MLAAVFGTGTVQHSTGLVESDHKPLESLFKKPLCMAPQCIQRMMLRVQRYDLIVKYRPGDQLHIAVLLAVLVSWSLHHRQMSLTSICLYKFQKKRLMSLREKRAVIQCYRN